MPEDQSNQNESQDQNPKPAVKARKRRKWPWVILVLFLLLIGLVVLIPTIASTGAVRSVVVGKVNENLNGTVEIGDWSLGWLSPIGLSGIKVYDDQKRLILDVPKIQLGISLLDAAKQNFNFGNDNLIEVASFDVRVDADGKSNLEKLVKSQPGAAPSTPAGSSSSEAGKIPNVSGKFTVNFRGTVEAANTPPVYVDQSSAVVTITDINKPIENNVKLVYRIGENKDASTIQTSGTVDAIENNVVNIDKLVAAEKIVLQNVNFAAAEPFAKKSDPTMKIGGIANGTLDVSAQGLTGISANGNIVVANLVFGGGPLGADQFKTSQLTIPITVTRTVVDATTTLIKIEKLGAEMSQATVAISGQVNEQALLNLSNQRAPGSDGTLSVQANVTDLKDLANQLRNTLKLDPSVQIDSGKITNAIAVNISKESVKATVNVNADAKGRRGNQPIELKPIALSFDATALPTGKPIPNVKDLKLNFTSDFMTITGGGESLAKIDIKGNYDLSKLRNEAAQFADLSKIQLQGTGDFAVTTAGDVADPNAPIDASATVNLLNVKVAGVANQQIDQDKLAIVAGGKITRKDNAPTGVQGGTFKLTSGADAASPLLAMTASGDIDLSKPQPTAPKWQFAIDTSSLTQLQKQYSGFVPALAEQKIEIVSGGFHINGSGAFDGTTLVMSEPIQMSIPSLEIKKDGKTVVSREVIRGSVGGSITLGQDKIGANLTALSLTSQSGLINIGKGDGPLMLSIVPSKSDISGNGTITIASNVKRIADLAQSFSATPPPADQPQLRSGQFAGTIVLSKADTTKIDFTGQLTALTVATNGKNAIDNEQLTIAINAVAPNDLAGKTPIAITGKIGSSFVNTTLSDVKVLLSAASVLDMLQSANVDVQAPDLAKLSALAQAFSPAPATPAPAGRARPAAMQQVPTDAPVSGNERISAPRPARPADRGDAAVVTEPIHPIEITKGAASIKMALTRDGAAKTTTVNVSDIQLANLSMRRGERYFDAKQPVAMKLVAKLNADSPDKINSISVDQLSGSTEFATFQASQPITITNPTSASPVYSGEFRARGNIDSALGFVSVMQGADRLPYQGEIDIVQKLDTKAGVTSLAGAIDVLKFRVLDEAKKVIREEDQIAIRNDITADLLKKIATINSLTVEMPKSQALGIKVNGRLTDWEKMRAISGLGADPSAKLSLNYDLEKLWPIVKPFLSAEMQEQYGKMPVKGKFVREYVASGMLPETIAAGETIFSKLNVSGALPLELVETPQGLNVRAFELVFEMKNGRVDLKPAPASPSRVAQVTGSSRRPNAPTTQVVARTGIANDGALNLDGIVIELNKPDMPVSISPRRVLLNDVKLNSVLADTLGKLGMVISVEASKAEGRLTVTVAECDHVPLGDLLKRKTGKAKFIIQIEDFELKGIMPSLLSQVADLGTDGIVGSMPPSTISLSGGQASTDLTIQLNKLVTDPRTNREVTRAIPLKLTGGLTLSDLALKNFTIDVPPELILRDMRKFFPNGVAVPLTGTASKPSLNLQKLIQENAVKGLLGNVTGNDAPADNRNNANRPGENNRNNNDPLGNLLDQLGGGNNNQDRNPPREAPRNPPAQPNPPRDRNQQR